MIVTPARREDLDALCGLVAAYHAHDGIDTTDARRRAALIGLLADPRLGRLWVARPDDAAPPRGYVVLTFDYSLEFGGREGFIDELFVAPAVRGRGVGRALLAHATRAARDLALGALHIVVEQDNAAALAFYARCGWAAPHRVLLSRELTTDDDDDDDATRR